MDKRGTKSTRLAQSKQKVVNRGRKNRGFPLQEALQTKPASKTTGAETPAKLRIEPQRGIALSQQTKAGRPISKLKTINLFLSSKLLELSRTNQKEIKVLQTGSQDQTGNFQTLWGVKITKTVPSFSRNNP
jgi:hypothetical protein